MKYFHLLRINNPAGFFLLLWPTLTALVIAGKGSIDLNLLLIFILGCFVMRSLGCLINDFIDRDLDKKVQRTKNRPLANNSVSLKNALLLLALLLSVALSLLTRLNMLCAYIAVIGFIMTVMYPCMKRITNFPQMFLGLVWSLSILMAYAATINQLTASAFILFFANFCLTVGYDTVYAISDRKCDLEADIKSFAIYIEGNECAVILAFKLLHILLMAIVGFLEDLGIYFWLSLLIFLVFSLIELGVVYSRKDAWCLRVFKLNQWPLFIGFLFTELSYINF